MNLFVEKTLDDLKDFVVANTEEYCALADTEAGDFTLPRLKEKQIQLGSFDIERYKEQVSMFIIPTDIVFEDYSMGETEVEIPVDMYLTFRKHDHDKLYRIASRYISLLRQMFEDKYTMNGLVDRVEVKTATYVADLFGDDDVKGVHIVMTIKKVI
jgi:hypothetical protein